MAKFEKIRNLDNDPQPPVTEAGESVWQSDTGEFWLVRESEHGQELQGTFYTFSAVEKENN